MYFRLVVLFCFLMICGLVTTASAQTPQNRTQTPDESTTSNSGYDPFSRSPFDEMRSKLKLKQEEKEFKVNLARAEEAETLCADLLKTYETTKSLNVGEQKKLERVEKLVKGIRKASGGDDDDETLLDQRPGNLNDALKIMAEETSNLNAAVKKTSRVTVSAAVIEKANALLEVIKLARSFQN